jgi:hypothetical protein
MYLDAGAMAIPEAKPRTGRASERPDTDNSQRVGLRNANVVAFDSWRRPDARLCFLGRAFLQIRSRSVTFSFKMTPNHKLVRTVRLRRPAAQLSR